MRSIIVLCVILVSIQQVCGSEYKSYDVSKFDKYDLYDFMLNYPCDDIAKETFDSFVKACPIHKRDDMVKYLYNPDGNLGSDPHGLDGLSHQARMVFSNYISYHYGCHLGNQTLIHLERRQFSPYWMAFDDIDGTINCRVGDDKPKCYTFESASNVKSGYDFVIKYFTRGYEFTYYITQKDMSAFNKTKTSYHAFSKSCNIDTRPIWRQHIGKIIIFSLLGILILYANLNPIKPSTSGGSVVDSKKAD
ncbi:MAG: hypothetical protein Edafosvirus1_79 [Edafosvirus sp.]|uniref:Uncharacterized protein n=1 Tax=Edafosvirus sp. TaxID=2487765 RepID=A0A3G4ZS83_9VIRU|nr:MAG: hypothetical protein Edafosvirus1_79 [Edafosvirus sp.]